MTVRSVLDERWMDRALRLSQRARRVAPPNPWVGAVVVKDDVIVGEGWTQKPGSHHAEKVALAMAGPSARGATLYVTLEPCAHEGRTPPCTVALREAGIERCVVGIIDPDPLVRGRGVVELREAGLDVEIGVLDEAILDALRTYVAQRVRERPWTILKVAMTLDGKIAAADGSSRWITSPSSREEVHRLRSEVDAIVVGAGTVRVDDPQLTARHADGTLYERQPARIVLGAIPEGAKVLPALSYIGAVDELLDRLGKQGVLSVLVEGGPKVAGQLHDQDLIDEYRWYVAPALMGSSSYDVLPSRPSATMDELWRGSFHEVRRCGDDIVVTMYSHRALGLLEAHLELSRSFRSTRGA